jgi:iron complex transport system ATP-binding protein
MMVLRLVRYGFAARADFLGPISLRIGRGDCWAIVGPNGAGKSTMLRLLAGLLKPRSGEIEFEGKSLGRLAARERARRIAFLPQQMSGDLDFRVADLVLMGRYPHRSLGLFESAEDHRIARQAMSRTQTLAFADRAVVTLSGGEAQRVHLAAALAQEPALLLLDEPTASLDLQHQLAVFDILREQTAGGGPAVVVVTHDVNLAARFCTHVLLLNDGKTVACGSPAEVLTPAVLEPVYDVALAALALPGGPGRRWLVPRYDTGVPVQ